MKAWWGKAAAALAVLAAGIVWAKPVEWQPDFDVAVTGAGQKVVMLVLCVDWNGWCKDMDKDVFGNAEVQEKIEANFIPVKLNPETSPRGAELQKKYGQQVYPHVIFVDKTGKKLGETTGLKTVEEFKLYLDQIKR